MSQSTREQLANADITISLDGKEISNKRVYINMDIFEKIVLQQFKDTFDALNDKCRKIKIERWNKRWRVKRKAKFKRMR